MTDQGKQEAGRPPGWTAADEALWGLCGELREARAACAALLARWDGGEDLAWTVQRELLTAALALDRLARQLAREFPAPGSGDACGRFVPPGGAR